MKLWKKVLIGTMAVAALGVGANFVAVAATGDRTPGVVDISGPCDEAEHANDPECAGVAGSAAEANQSAGRVDISGPCDEAEHANDARCNGAQVNGDDGDRRGDHDDDRSGPSENSGPGNDDGGGRQGDHDGEDEDEGDDD
jgi:hypothetical protein